MMTTLIFAGKFLFAFFISGFFFFLTLALAHELPFMLYYTTHSWIIQIIRTSLLVMGAIFAVLKFLLIIEFTSLKQILLSTNALLIFNIAFYGIGVLLLTIIIYDLHYNFHP